MKKITYYVVSILLYSMLAGCSQLSSLEKTIQEKETIQEEKITIQTSFVVKGDWELPENVPCSIATSVNNILKGKEPYLENTIVRELKVKVKDSQGDIVSISNLTKPKTVKGNYSNYSNCAFSSTISEVPISNFYTISIGNIEETFSKDEILQDVVNIYTDSDTLRNLVVN